MCDEREQLIGYVYGECDADERERVGRHLAECEDCRAEISGLQRVREDLLAWDVPQHESVWKPFAPPATTLWRQVPTWAMATAASLTFVVGAAGGLVTHAMTSGAPEFEAPAMTVVRPGPDEAELAEVSSQLTALQAALDAQTVELDLVRTAAANTDLSVADTVDEFLGLFTNINMTMADNAREISELRTELANYAATQQSGRN